MKLLADGVETDAVELNEANEWEHVFTHLPEFRDGVPIVYTLEEVQVEGYEGSLSGDRQRGFTLTNTHIPETLTIEGSKTWDDENDTAGLRPRSVVVRLHADGAEVDRRTVTPENGVWSWSFSGLPRYHSGGTEYIYTISEDHVEDYSVYRDGYNLINRYTPGKTSLNVSKIWDDEDDHDGIRPAAVTVELLANGEDTGMSVALKISGPRFLRNWMSSGTGSGWFIRLPSFARM